MISINFKLISHFDRVEQASARGARRAHTRSGAILRSMMRRRIKYRANKNSDPGETPFSHVKGSGFGLKSILYHYDPRSRETIVGPIGGSERTGAPRALELGGRSKIKLSRWQRRATGRTYRTARIQKRSFAGPALEAFSTEYPELWRGVIE